MYNYRENMERARAIRNISDIYRSPALPGLRQSALNGLYFEDQPLIPFVMRSNERTAQRPETQELPEGLRCISPERIQPTPFPQLPPLPSYVRPSLSTQDRQQHYQHQQQEQQEQHLDDHPLIPFLMRSNERTAQRPEIQELPEGLRRISPERIQPTPFPQLQPFPQLPPLPSYLRPSLSTQDRQQHYQHQQQEQQEQQHQEQEQHQQQQHLDDHPLIPFLMRSNERTAQRPEIQELPEGLRRISLERMQPTPFPQLQPFPQLPPLPSYLRPSLSTQDQQQHYQHQQQQQQHHREQEQHHQQQQQQPRQVRRGVPKPFGRCRLQCGSVISLESIQKISNQYWALATQKERNQYMISFIETGATPIDQQRINFEYFLESNGRRTVVCRKHFQECFGVSCSFMTFLLQTNFDHTRPGPVPNQQHRHEVPVPVYPSAFTRLFQPYQTQPHESPSDERHPPEQQQPKQQPHSQPQQQQQHQKSRTIGKRICRPFDECQLQCARRFPFHLIKTLYDYYWSLETKQSRNRYLVKLITVKDTPIGQFRMLYEYGLEINGRRTVVCRKHFGDCFGVSYSYIQSILLSTFRDIRAVVQQNNRIATNIRSNTCLACRRPMLDERAENT